MTLDIGGGSYWSGSAAARPFLVHSPQTPAATQHDLVDAPPGKVADAVSELNRLTIVVTTKAVSK